MALNKELARQRIADLMAKQSQEVTSRDIAGDKIESQGVINSVDCEKVGNKDSCWKFRDLP